MGQTTLIAHSGAKYVPEAIVRAEPEPAFTKSWRPYSHAAVIDAVQGACAAAGYSVGEKRFAMTPGANMFAAWDIVARPAGALATTKDYTLSLGFRNSINKTFAVGLCAGERVFVCDNLVFSGDIVLFRKHTALLEIDELTMLAAEAMAEIGPRFDRTLSWHQSLQDTALTDHQASLLLVAAMRRTNPIVPPAKFQTFYNLYFAAGSKYTRTLHGFHGAATEMFRDLDPIWLLWRTQMLVEFLDFEAKKIIGLDKAYIDLEKVEDEGQALFKARQKTERVEAGKSGQDIKEKVRKALTDQRAVNGKPLEPAELKDNFVIKEPAPVDLVPEKSVQAQESDAVAPVKPKRAKKAKAAPKQAEEIPGEVTTAQDVPSQPAPAEAQKKAKRPKMAEVDKEMAAKRKAARAKSSYKTAPAVKGEPRLLKPVDAVDWVAEEIADLEKKGF